MTATLPRKESILDQLDAGWCFLIAGLALIAAMTLIPPADDLAGLNYRRDRLAAREHDSVARLDAYTTFLDAVDNRDPDLVRRLAVSQLNLIPEQSQPVGIIGTDLDAYVDHWIVQTLPPPVSTLSPVIKDTLLRRLSQPATKLWVIIGGAVLVFVGLLPQSVEECPEVEYEESSILSGGSSAPAEDDILPDPTDAEALSILPADDAGDTARPEEGEAFPILAQDNDSDTDVSVGQFEFAPQPAGDFNDADAAANEEKMEDALAASEGPAPESTSPRYTATILQPSASPAQILRARGTLPVVVDLPSSGAAKEEQEDAVRQSLLSVSPSHVAAIHPDDAGASQQENAKPQINISRAFRRGGDPTERCQTASISSELEIRLVESPLNSVPQPQPRRNDQLLFEDHDNNQPAP